jgi:hypothetical protein
MLDDLTTKEKQPVGNFAQKLLDGRDRLLAVCYNTSATDFNQHKARYEATIELFDQSKDGGLQLLACLIQFHLGSKPHPSWFQKYPELEMRFAK